ncbi:MAG: response regulator, partial [Rikenellaceae bacterium]
MQNKLLSLITEHLPLGLIMYDKDGGVEYANNIALGMFGVTLNEIKGANIFDDPNISDEDKVKLKKGLSVSFETDYDFNLCRENVVKTTKINDKRYLSTKVSVPCDENGVSQGFLLTCEDITENKLREREIANSYKKIRATQRELSLALNVGNLTSWNYDIKSKMFYRFDDKLEICESLTLQSVLDRIHKDDRDGFIALLYDATYKKELINNETVLRILERKSKQYRYYNFVYSLKDDNNGEVSGVMFIQRDITEDVKYQQNLILAKNKAEEADKLKSTFLATMSHEIRTPLNAIVGFSQLLSEITDVEEKNEYRQLIETNSEILLKLIGDILDLSKIEAGSVDINRQELDLAQLCQELYQSFKQRIQNPDVTLRFINPYSKCIANLDKHRFIQIFTNFVTNAIKYTPKGYIEMGYECKPNQIRFYVKDTGIGIANEKKSLIFSRFEKLDDFAQGSGLGLSICKAIADATGGKIGFHSEANQGSEFWYVGYTNVDFVEKLEISEADNNLESVGFDENASCKNKKELEILVAEDNDSNFLLIKNILKEYHLTRAVTGLEAVEKVKTQHFDFVFMDIKMPIMNGLDATSNIRKFNSTIPIVALTANAFNEDKEAALAAGCNYFMTKPVTKRELIAVLS